MPGRGGGIEAPAVSKGSAEIPLGRHHSDSDSLLGRPQMPVAHNNTHEHDLARKRVQTGAIESVVRGMPETVGGSGQEFTKRQARTADPSTVPKSAPQDQWSPARAGSRRNRPDAGLAPQTIPTKLVRTEQTRTEQGCLSHSKTSRYNTNPAQKNREIRVAFPIPLVDNPRLPHRPSPATRRGNW